MSARFSRPATIWIIPAVIVIGGTLLSDHLVQVSRERQAHLDQEHFASDLSRAVDDIHASLATKLTLLRSGAGFLEASGGTIDAALWRNYVRSLDLDANHPGLHGLGVILPIRPDEVPGFLEEVRRKGSRDFTLKPVPNVPDSERVADRHYVITHIEPLERNLPVRGLDVASELTRRVAAELARDSGRPAMTRPITLVQDGKQRPGFLLFVPVYRLPAETEMGPGTGRGFIGWVYAPFVHELFFDAALRDWRDRFGMRVIATDKSGDEVPVYEKNWDSAPDEDLLTGRTRIELAGELFTVEWQQGLGTTVANADRTGWVFVMGVTISLLLAGFLVAVLLAVRRSQASAVEQTLAAKESEQQLQDFAQIAADWVWELDADLRFTLNTAESSFAGFSGADVIGLRPWDRPWNDQGQMDIARLRKVLGGYKPFRQVVRAIEGDDGRKRYARMSGAPLFDKAGKFKGYRGTGIDVTATVEAETRVKQSQERLELALSGGDMSIWDSDFEAGTLTVVGGLYGKLGYAEHETPKTSAEWGMLVHADDAPQVEANITALKQGLTKIFESEMRLRAKNGTWRWILARGRAVEYAANGKPRRFVGSELDITERHAAAASLNQVQKMEAIGQLTGGIAHDFNNILMILDGYARRILEKQDDRPAVEFSVKQIKMAVEKAKGVTKGLLTFSRRRDLQRRVFDLDATVIEMTELMKRAADESFELVFELDAGGAFVNTDSDELGQALLNLVVNARDAMGSKGGTIIVGTRRATAVAPGTDDADGPTAAEYVEIYVRDHGCGMDEHVRQHVFEPFFTTKNQGKGTGLGLAMVYGFCRQSEGKVEIDSAVGNGTTVTMFLPVSKGAAKSTVVEELKDAPRGKGELALLIEDDEALLPLVKEALEGAGYTVMAASSGFDALEMTQDAERPVDVIVTDIVMPGLSGIELSAILAERYPNAPVIFMSGYPSRGDRDYGNLPDDACFLQKPVRPDELARTIRRQLDQGILKEAV